jgi:hypothetical protein
MIRFLQLAISTLACIFMLGCAHPINIAPNMALVKGEGIAKIDKKVGYHISDASKALEVTGPGGGGDKIRYFPYRDFEAGFYMALNEVFTEVTRVSDPKDTAMLKKDGVSLLITPEIETQSSSPSLLTWPPTKFTLNLSCKVVDASGSVLDTVRVRGEGQAEFSEFKNNFSLAATRASNEALTRLIKALGESKVLRQ